ncbi:hypothetical protein BGZ74_003448, partial [Mortierella antarctica]
MGHVYDMTSYIQNCRQGVITPKAGALAPGSTNAAFTKPNVVDLFATSAGDHVLLLDDPRHT